MASKNERIVEALLSSTKPYKRVVTGTGEIFTAFYRDEEWHVVYEFSSNSRKSTDADLLKAVIKVVESSNPDPYT